MFYFFNCCKKTNYQDEVVNTNTSQIETKDTIKSQKKEKKNPMNPFLLPINFVIIVTKVFPINKK